MDELLLKIQDGNILTESTKAEIERVFNEAVEVKATQIAAEQIHLSEAELTEKYEQLFTEAKLSLLDEMDTFLEEQMDKFASVVAEKLDNEIEIERAKAANAVFENLVTITGVDRNILYEKAKRDNDISYNRLLSDFDAAYQEINELKKQNLILRTHNIISEKTKNMNLVDAEKFKSAVYLLNVDENFEKSIDTLYESFVNKSSTTSNSLGADNHDLNESYSQYKYDEDSRAKSLKF